MNAKKGDKTTCPADDSGKDHYTQVVVGIEASWVFFSEGVQQDGKQDKHDPSIERVLAVGKNTLSMNIEKESTDQWYKWKMGI